MADYDLVELFNEYSSARRQFDEASEAFLASAQRRKVALKEFIGIAMQSNRDENGYEEVFDRYLLENNKFPSLQGALAIARWQCAELLKELTETIEEESEEVAAQFDRTIAEVAARKPNIPTL